VADGHVLHVFANPQADSPFQPPLADLSAMWTKFATENQDIEFSTIKFEWWTTLETLWTTIDRLKAVFTGTPYPLHLDVVEKWRVLFSAKTPGWMMVISLDCSTDQAIYVFRRQVCFIFYDGYLDFAHHASSTPFSSQTKALNCLGVLRC